MGALTTPIVSPIAAAITTALTGMGEASSALSALTLAWSAGASTLTIGATSSIDLVKFGAYISEGEGVDPVTGGVWFDGAGAVAGAQSLVLTQAALEAELGALPASAVLNVSHGYSLTDPAVTVVLAASSGVYPTPVVYTAAVDDTTPTEGVLITGSWDMIVGPTGQVISYRYQNVTEGVTNATTLTYTPDAGDVGDTLQFRVTSTLGGLTAYDDSDVTDAVVAGTSQVVFDAVSGGAAFDTTVTVGHVPVGTPTKALAVFSIAQHSVTGPSVSVTYGGEAMTKVAEMNDGTYWKWEIWELVNPPSGNQNFVGTVTSGTNFIRIDGFTYTGGSTTTCTRASPPTPTTGTSTAASITVTSAADDLVFAFCTADVTAALAPASGETERADYTFAGAIQHGAYEADGAASVSMDVTIPSSAWWHMMAVSLQG